MLKRATEFRRARVTTTRTSLHTAPATPFHEKFYGR
jgi:hypothetical protein